MPRHDTVLSLGLALMLSLLPGLSVPPAEAQTMVDIATPAALPAALAAAGPGTTLRLAPGDYGALVASDLAGTAAAPLVLRSADPARRAVFSGMDLRGAKNLVLEDLMFDYTFRAGDKLGLRAFEISDSENVTVRRSLFDGDVAQGVSADDDGFGYSFGLSVGGGTGITVEDNEIRGFYRGLAINRSKDVTVRGNNLYGMRMDGMNFAQIEKGLIEGNRIHDFRRSIDSKDHSDMIQFWTNKTAIPSYDIVIRDNVLNSGKGWYTQSIFMRNEMVDKGLAGPEMFYRNITIENNVIINAHLHGITVGEATGLTIANNTIVRNAASEGKIAKPVQWTPQIRVASRSQNVRITKNVVSKITGFEKQPDWDVSGNFLIQDTSPSRSGYFDKVFVAALSGDPRDLASFAYLPGGPLDKTGIGAPRLNAP